MENKPDPGSEIRDEHPRSYFRELMNSLKILKFFDANTDSGSF